MAPVTRLRVLSPKFTQDIFARRVDMAAEELAVKVIVSRSYWVGAQDYDSCLDYRLEQMLGFGLIDHATFVRTLASLEARGALVSPEVAAREAAEIDPRTSAALRAPVIEAQARLAAIARLAETIGGDVGGLGPAAMTASTGLGERLQTIQAQLDAIARELQAARGAYLAAETERLGVTAARDLKVHLGAGPTRLEGWVNGDVFPSELSFNLSWGLPFADGAVAFIYSGHVFEHLYYAAEALALLREVKRVLAPGGVFRFIVPDMGLFFRKYAAGDRGFFEHWKQTAVRFFNLFDTPMELTMMYSMVGADPSEFFAHKMGYDFETLEKLGREAGFATITQSSYMASVHPELRVDEISAAAKLSYEGERYSLFVEFAT